MSLDITIPMQAIAQVAYESNKAYHAAIFGARHQPAWNQLDRDSQVKMTKLVIKVLNGCTEEELWREANRLEKRSNDVFKQFPSWGRLTENHKRTYRLFMYTVQGLAKGPNEPNKKSLHVEYDQNGQVAVDESVEVEQVGYSEPTAQMPTEIPIETPTVRVAFTKDEEVYRRDLREPNSTAPVE